MRFRCLVVGILGVAGCHSLFSPDPVAPQPVPPAEQTPASPGPAEVPRPSPPPVAPPSTPPAASDPEPVAANDPLTLAAECLGRGDQPAAAAYLETYVRGHPDQLMFRVQLADLLLRVGRPRDARAHYERFVSDAQAATGPPKAHLVHCHTKLMEIGQQADDRFAEVFHRGVGLLVLIQESPAGGDEVGEEILCQAIQALTEAAELRPTDPRVPLYLADAYDRIGNRRGADTARAAARNLAVPGALTPYEARRLALAPGGR